MRNYLLLLFFLGSLFVQAQDYNLLGSAQALGGDCYQITPDSQIKTGAAWYQDKLDLRESFDIEFFMNFGINNWGADGMAFIIQTVGDKALGNHSGGLGFSGFSPSLGIEFDTYQNTEIGDPWYDHIAVLSNGDIAHSSPTTLTPYVPALLDEGNIEDGKDYFVRIIWDAGNNLLTVYFDCQKRLELRKDIIKDIFNGEPIVYWGVSGATGGASNAQKVCLRKKNLYAKNYFICEGGNVTLNTRTSPTNEYSWSPSKGLNNTKSQNPTASPTQTTTYTVQYKDYCKQDVTDEITVNVEPKIQLEILGKNYFCPKEKIKLEAKTKAIQEYRPGLEGKFWKFVNFNGISPDPQLSDTPPSYRTPLQGVNLSHVSTDPIVSVLGTVLYLAEIEGFIKAPLTGNLTLVIVADDGFRMWVDDKQVLSPSWGLRGTSRYTVDISVIEGQWYPIKMQYFNGLGHLYLQLKWIFNGKELFVPAANLQTFNNPFFQWDNGTVEGSRLITESGEYTVKATTQYCASEATKVIHKSIPFSVGIVSDKVRLCGDGKDKVVLSAQVLPTTVRIDSILWSDGKKDLLNSVAKSGDYSVALTSFQGCKEQATFTVSEQSPLVTALDSVYFMCEEKKISLSPKVYSEAAYTWENGTHEMIREVPSGNYHLTIEDGICKTVQSIRVKQESNIEGALEGEDVLCPGGNLTLVPKLKIPDSEIKSYEWSNGVKTPENIISEEGEYTLEIKTEKCSKKLSKTISLSPSFSVAIVPEKLALCVGSSLKLRGEVLPKTSSISDYLWSTGETIPEINTTSSGKFTLRIRNSDGCSRDTSYVLVSEKSHFLNSFNGDQFLCKGDSLNLRPIFYSDASYSWSFEENGVWKPLGISSELKVTEAGTYGLLVKNSTCEFKEEIKVRLADDFEVGILGSSLFCQGSPSFLKAVVNPSSTAILEYEWSNGSAKDSTGVWIPGEYEVRAKTQHCVKKATHKIDHFPAFSTKIILDKPKLCLGGVLKLSVNNSGVGVNYEWSNGSKDREIGIRSAGFYGVKVQDDKGCFARDSVEVKSQSQFNLGISAAYFFCEQESITVYPRYYSGASYVWNSGTAEGAGIKFTKAGEYSVLVSDDVCRLEERIQVIEKMKDKFSLTFPKNRCIETPLILHTPKPSFLTTQYLWSNGTNESFMVLNKANHEYWLQSETEGCFFRELITTNFVNCPLKNLTLPNIFSPNGDGDNDTFRFSTLGMLSYDFVIFDRWGGIIFSTHGGSSNSIGDVFWNGKTSNGTECGEDSYPWQLTFEYIDEDKSPKSQTLSGALQLVR